VKAFLISLLIIIATVLTAPFVNADLKDINWDVALKDLKPCVITFDKPYRFYHYTYADKIRQYTPYIPLEKAIREHAKLWTGFSALYLAPDPIISQGYADPDKDDFLLYRVELPAGTKLFDLRRGCALSDQAFEELYKNGCYLDRKLVASGNESSCHRIMASKLGISGELYAWSQGYPPNHCKNAAYLSFALQLTNSSLLNGKNVAIFSETAPLVGAENFGEAVEIEKIFEDSVGYSKPRWASLAPYASKGEPVSSIEGRYLYSCQP
jgi:hypothetical protein